MTMTGKIDEILMDRHQWNQSSPIHQDQVIDKIRQALAPAFDFVQTQSYSCQHVTHRIATFRHLKTRIELQLIPGGSYVKGTSDPEAELTFIRQVRPIFDPDFVELEKAQTMTIAPMLIGRFPVTYAQWGKIQRRWKHQEWKGWSFPLESVSWNKVQAWLTKAGDGLRLPWEREWEYACRAGTETRFFWSQEMDFAYCWERSNSGGQTHKVTEHVNQSNAFGLVDMLGNVAEWCQDEYVDPELWYADPYRVIRGGNVAQDAVSCRCANVKLGLPFFDEGYVGFRVALTLPGLS